MRKLSFLEETSLPHLALSLRALDSIYSGAVQEINHSTIKQGPQDQVHNSRITAGAYDGPLEVWLIILLLLIAQWV